LAPISCAHHTGRMVLAHQGGWDEFLLVAAPVAFFAFLLWLANRRAQANFEKRESTAEAPDQRD
jgi:hypothetical protein